MRPKIWELYGKLFWFPDKISQKNHKSILNFEHVLATGTQVRQVYNNISNSLIKSKIHKNHIKNGGTL